METTMNNLHPDTSAPVDETPQPNAAERRAGRPGDDLVRWAEFRLALWIGGFALAVIISGQGLLFSAILNMQGEMQTQFGELRERVVRIETKLDAVETRLDAVETRLGAVETRLGAVETRLDTIIPPPT